MAKSSFLFILFFIFIYLCFSLCNVLFSSSFHIVKILKIRVIKQLVVKLRCKQGGKPATGTVRIGFGFG